MNAAAETHTIETYQQFPPKGATADQIDVLDQLIAIDGHDAVVVSSEDIRNASGRIIGKRTTVTAEAWATVLEAIEATQ